ncbi:hypothetical protein HZH68_007153 [Vespula germanica]|uniref:Uncharacterized protein n=1 Tax=Vespula germanica TaxID=30212 RepID=A0A834K6Z2_VESGE|nr:hypothetical protein HZH68_007153 [Vespula germanica]
MKILEDSNFLKREFHDTLVATTSTSVSLGVSKCVEPMKSAKRYEISLIGEWRPPLVMNTDEPTTNIFLLERNRQPSTDYSICSTAD